MSNLAGYAVARTHATERFYNPPAIRRVQQLAQQRHYQQNQLRQRVQQLQRPPQSEIRVDSAQKETRTERDESTLSTPNSGGSSSSPSRTANLTNLDRLMSSVTPFVPAHFLSDETTLKGGKTPEDDDMPYFGLDDLWESLREWSAYGAEVPLLVPGQDNVKQYYVPYLSGIQLYVEPNSPRKPSEDGDAEFTKETISVIDKQAEDQGGVDAASKQINLMNLNSGDEVEVCNSHGQLVFEFFEREQPHNRPPLLDKVSILASQFPDLKTYKSCDLLPSSWFSVAWYPIYRIPVASSLKDFDAAFLTFHTLSTHSRSKNDRQFHVSHGRKVYGADSSLISLPTFALAHYKLSNSVYNPNGDAELKEADSLVEAANKWLQNLEVKHPDFQFFFSHSSRRR